MAHVGKMVLVDPRLLETLRTPIQPPIDTNLRHLDSEMTRCNEFRIFIYSLSGQDQTGSYERRTICGRTPQA